MKHKNKILKILTTIGFIFAIAMGITFIKALNNQGPKIENIVEVSRPFKREFSNVVTKRRVEPIIDINFAKPDGSQTNWNNFTGEYLLVNFWATWCAPCVVELPSLDRLSKKFEGKGLNVIGISLDTMRSHEDVKLFLENRNIGEFAAYFDNFQEIQSKISMRGIPTSILLDKKGNILHIFEGDAQWDSPSSVEFFANLLKL